VKVILSVSPAFTITDVVVIVQVLATLDGPDVFPHDSIATRMGNSRYRCAFGTTSAESLDVTAER